MEIAGDTALASQEHSIDAYEFLTHFHFESQCDRDAPESLRKEAFVNYMAFLQKAFPHAEFTIGNISDETLHGAFAESKLMRDLIALSRANPTEFIPLPVLPSGSLAIHSCEIETYLSPEDIVSFETRTQQAVSEEAKKEIRELVSATLKSRIQKREEELSSIENEKDKTKHISTAVISGGVLLAASQIVHAALELTRHPAQAALESIYAACFAGIAGAIFGICRKMKKQQLAILSNRQKQIEREIKKK